MQLNRDQRRALKKFKPRKVRNIPDRPITIRFSQEVETDLMLEPMLCAEKLRAGEADEEDWHTVMAKLNVARFLNREHFNEGEKLIAEAQMAMRTIKAWGDQYNHWQADPKEFKAIAAALALSNEMQKMCTRRELRDALRDVYNVNEYINKTQAIKNVIDAKHS